MDAGENYLISKAKLSQSTDPFAAKAWILTAKTLYPNNFGVQVIYGFPYFQSQYSSLTYAFSCCLV